MPGRFIKKVSLESPVVECTPIIWKERLVLQEVWQTSWNEKKVIPDKDVIFSVQFRDVENEDIIARCPPDINGRASSFVWNDTAYVFSSRHETDPATGKVTSNHVFMSSSTDLENWSAPELVVKQEEGEQCYNQSVCHDGRRFVMAYETNSFVPFTMKFAVSDDLSTWQKLDGAIFGKDRYAACPAIRHSNGYYYMLYLEQFDSPRSFETYIARSKDLMEWETSPHNPVLIPDRLRDIHPDSPYLRRNSFPDCVEISKECNASDPDLIEWRGRTRIYFTGGNQLWCGDLQYVEYDGSMRDFFNSYFK